MVADAIAHIMGKPNCKIFPYVDDLVMVSPRDTANKYFDILADLITEHGLPINPDKITPPSKTLTCLGITIDIDAGTLSIDKHKLKDIYQECIQVYLKIFFEQEEVPVLTRQIVVYLQVCGP